MAAYLRLELRRLGRRPSVLLLGIGLPAVVYLLNTQAHRGALAGMSVKTYLLGSMLGWTALITAISPGSEIAAERASGWTQQLRTTPLPASGYFVAKVLTSLAAVALGVALIGFEGILTHAITATRWPIIVAVTLFAVTPLVVLSIALGCTVDEVALRPAASAITFTLSVVGGLWWPITMFPGVVQSVAKVLPTYHVATVERSIAAGGAPWVGNLVVLAAWAVALSAVVLWRFQQDEAGFGPNR